MLILAELKLCVTYLYGFWIFFSQGITVPSFIIMGFVSNILGKGPLCSSPHPWAASGRAILNRVKGKYKKIFNVKNKWLNSTNIVEALTDTLDVKYRWLKFNRLRLRLHVQLVLIVEDLAILESFKFRKLNISIVNVTLKSQLD